MMNTLCRSQLASPDEDMMVTSPTHCATQQPGTKALQGLLLCTLALGNLEQRQDGWGKGAPTASALPLPAQNSQK